MLVVILRDVTSISSGERTEVLHGTSNVMDKEVQFFSNAKFKIDTCMDHTRPSLALRIESIKKSFLDAKNRHVKLRYITEITTENMSYCKELMKIAEVRHLDGIKGNFMVSEGEYLAPAVSQEVSEVASQIICSNLKEIVEHEHYVFDTLWNKAIPAIRSIREIEEGVQAIATKVLENPDEIFNHIRYVIENASERSVCSSFGGMQVVYNNFFDLYKKILNKHGKGRGGGRVRWITSINKDSKDLVRIFLDAGAQIRHVKNLPPMNFAVDNRHFYATIDKMEGGKMIQSLLSSNEPAYIDYYNSFFEELWKNGIDSSQRITDIEEGVDLVDIEVFRNAPAARELYLDIVKKATKEILFIFPTSNAFFRQRKMGAIGLAEKAAVERNVKVRILMPPNKSAYETIIHLKENHPDHLGIRYIEQMSDTLATILVVDRKESLVMELRDDSKTSFDEAIGLSTYSNSKAGVLSYVAIFENLWKQTELYDDIKKANEQLKMHDIMQKEFIDIAAHELRTPIQPILGLTELLRSQIIDVEQRELLDVTIRNAKRLQRLTEDILDVTKIETKSLDLKKELFDLNQLILNAIKDSKNQIAKENKTNSLVLELLDTKNVILIKADKGRINQVLSNLLSNAIRFTNEGSIRMAIEKKNKSNDVIVSIKDTGIGLDPEILPRLFTKFATKSTAAISGGTGLGLFISKSIVEAHAGRIWAENNKDGKGAAFSFSLPTDY